MPELVVPSLQWGQDFREALLEAAAADEAIPWDPDLDEDALRAGVERMALGIWGPGATEPTQHMRWWVDGDRYLGRISLRLRALRDAAPEYYALHGDIGYDVRPTARGRGVATSMLTAVLNLAWALDFPDVLITCDVDNIASRRVIEKAGGEFVDVYTGEETVRRYRFTASR